MFRMLTVISCLLLVLGSTWAQTKAPLPDDQQRQLLAIIRQGNVEQMKAMLVKDPGLLEAPVFDKTPLTIAVESGQPAMVKFLIAQGANVKVVDRTPIFWGYSGRLPDINTTLLHTAARRGQKELVATFLDLGLDVNARTGSMQFTPLLLCAGGRLTDAPRLEAIEFLLAHGADPNAAAVIPAECIPAGFEAMSRLPGFGTPMMYAAQEHGGKELEALLLRYHAEPLPEESRKVFRRYFKLLPCLINLQTVANGGRKWADLHQNVMPKAATVWQDLIATKSVQPQGRFRCWARRGVENACGYNAALSGLDISRVKDPATVLVFADCQSGDNLIRSLNDIDAVRHEGGFIAVFLDWHVAYVKAEDINKIVLKPEKAPRRKLRFLYRNNSRMRSARAIWPR